MRTVERGQDADGPIDDDEPETVINPGAASLVVLRDKARLVAELLDLARDIAADADAVALRESARAGRSRAREAGGSPDRPPVSSAQGSPLAACKSSRSRQPKPSSGGWRRRITRDVRA